MMIWTKGRDLIVFNSTKGELNRNRKLSREQVIAIRREFDSGKRGLACAGRYGIHPVTYNKIGRRESWRCVAEDQG